MKIDETICVQINKSQIEACHRLKKGKSDRFARAIIRFTNRKNCDNRQRKKKNLKYAKSRSVCEISLGEV